MRTSTSPSPASVRIPVVLLSVSFALLLGSLAVGLGGDILPFEGGHDRAFSASLQRAFQAERLVFWIAAAILVVLAIARIRRQEPPILPPGHFTRGYTRFLFASALLLVLLVVIDRALLATRATSGLNASVVEFVDLCYVSTAVFVAAVVGLRARASAYAIPASTAALVFLLVIFPPAGLVGFFFWRSARKAEKHQTQ